MKILVLSTWYPYPPDNGSKLRAYYLAKSLAEQHDVTMIAFRPQSNADQGKNVLPAELHVIGVPDDPFRYVSLPHWAKYLSFSPVAFRRSPAMENAVAAQADRGPWDVVVALQVPMAQYARQVPAKCRVIDVDTAMSYQMHERYAGTDGQPARASRWVSWQKAHRYERSMLRHFQAATVVWGAEADFLRRMMKDNRFPVAVIPNGVDCAYNRRGCAASHPKTLVYSGSLTYSANFDAMRWFLAEIYPLIKAEEPGVRLTITGSTQGVELSHLNLDDSVQLTGFVDDVRTHVAGAALCVVPLRQGGGTRLKILEAMALETPVISTTKGAEGLAVTNGVHLLLADTPAEFARVTLSLLANPHACADLATNSRRLVEEQYDWTHVGSDFVALVEETARMQSKLPVGESCA